MSPKTIQARNGDNCNIALHCVERLRFHDIFLTEVSNDGSDCQRRRVTGVGMSLPEVCFKIDGSAGALPSRTNFRAPRLL